MYSWDNMLVRIIIATTILACTLLVWMLSTTNPAEVGPLGVLTVFICMYVSLIGLATFLILQSNRLIIYLAQHITLRRPVGRVTVKRAYYYSTVVALAPMMLLGLHSVGRIGVYEFSLVVLFVAIGCLYIAKRA